MTKKSNALGASFLVLLLSGGFAASSSTTSNQSDTSNDDDGSSGGLPPTPQCEDGIDNDGDGTIDGDDPDCDTNSPMYNGNES